MLLTAETAECSESLQCMTSDRNKLPNGFSHSIGYTATIVHSTNDDDRSKSMQQVNMNYGLISRYTKQVP